MNHSLIVQPLLRVMPLLAAWFVVLGCKSPDPAAGNRFAAVTIRSCSFQEIEMAVSEVFVKHGYQRARLPGATMIFEKQASNYSTLAYSGLSGKPLWIRVKLDIRITGPETRVVECKAYRVIDRNDPSMEEENPVPKLNRGPYQDLLMEVRAVLNPPAGP